MRFFSSWWERIPTRHAAPTLLTALALAGALSHAGAFFKAIFAPYGFSWG